MPRSAILAGFASPALQRLIDVQVQTEQLTVTLMVMAGPAKAETVEEELERRTSALVEHWRSLPDAPLEPPPILALRSMIDDVARGYF